MLGGLCAVVVLFLMQPTGFAANITIETVPVSNAGNAVDTTGFGEVDYNYRIGTTEVTNAQYVTFLNAVDPTGVNELRLFNEEMSVEGFGGIDFYDEAAEGAKYGAKSDAENKPVTFVNWYDAIRFVNWLHNGQGMGDTETGAYTLGELGNNAIPVNASAITRNPGATWFLPTEDEWYKAAYHKNDGVTGNYYLYPTASDSEPTNDPPPGGSNSANFDFHEPLGSPIDVASFVESASPYGTFDQGGNVWEWNETYDFGDRVLRGASFVDTPHFLSAPDSGESLNPVYEHGAFGALIGFRVATVPEPSALALASMALLGGLLIRRRCQKA